MRTKLKKNQEPKKKKVKIKKKSLWINSNPQC